MVRLFARATAVALLAGGAVSLSAQDDLFQTTLVGVVVPDDVRPGDEVMGTVTLDPAKYEGIPGLRVLTAEIPPPTGTVTGNVVEIAAPNDARVSGQLSGLIVDIPKDKEEQQKRANLGKIYFKAAELGLQQLPLLFRRQGAAQPIATRAVPVERAPAPATAAGPPPETFEMPSVIGSNDMPTISGPIGASPQVSVGDTPCEIVASTPRAATFEVPPNVQSGAQTVTLQDSPRAMATASSPAGSSAQPSATGATPSTPAATGSAPSTAAPRRTVEFENVAVLNVGVAASGPAKVVDRGSETPIQVALTGTVPPELFERPLPANSRYLMRIPYRALRGAPAPGQKGKIGILVENRSPQTIRLDGEQNRTIVKWFDRNDLARGNAVIKTKLIATRVGAYNVRARVMPMLPPALGRIARSPQ